MTSSKKQKTKKNKMGARRRSVNNYDANKPFAVKGSDNHLPETLVTGAYMPIGFHTPYTQRVGNYLQNREDLKSDRK